MADYASLCRQFEEQLGVKLKRAFFENIRVSVQGDRAVGLSAQHQLHAMFAIFLESDMNAVGAGCLPPNIQVGPEATILGQKSRSTQPTGSPPAGPPYLLSNATGNACLTDSSSAAGVAQEGTGGQICGAD